MTTLAYSPNTVREGMIVGMMDTVSGERSYFDMLKDLHLSKEAAG